MVNMTVRPQDILKGDIINHAGAIVRVTEIVRIRHHAYRFVVKCLTTGEVRWRYYQPDMTVKLLSI
jgi:translation elongation factor P/translation initiation factor 5A